jgi:hypothetical protein
MEAIVRRRQRRKLVERKKGELAFRLRGNPVQAEKIDRWMKRNGIAEDTLYAPSLAAGKQPSNLLSLLAQITKYVFSHANRSQCLDKFHTQFTSSKLFRSYGVVEPNIRICIFFQRGPLSLLTNSIRNQHHNDTEQRIYGTKPHYLLSNTWSIGRLDNCTDIAITIP